MAGRTQTELNRALEDLNEGVRVLFGFDGSDPKFLGARLHGGDEDEREPVEQRRDSQPSARRRRSRRSSKVRLARIK